MLTMHGAEMGTRTGATQVDNITELSNLNGHHGSGNEIEEGIGKRSLKEKKRG